MTLFILGNFIIKNIFHQNPATGQWVGGVYSLEVLAGHLAGAGPALLSSAVPKVSFGIFQQRQLLG